MKRSVTVVPIIIIIYLVHKKSTTYIHEFCSTRLTEVRNWKPVEQDNIMELHS